jgi:hypothetical protein
MTLDRSVMKQKAGLDINKRLTNHSARKYLVQKLKDNNVEDTDIMQISGHKRIARSGYCKYDHECRKAHQIKRVCGTCYAHEFNLNVFRHE